MDRRTYELCYPGLGVGEIESMSGGVFGHAFLAINPILLGDENLEVQPGVFPMDRLTWNPYFCQECRWKIVAQLRRGNYNYRCCPHCWNIIKGQLWEYLEGKVTENPANRIWSFLVEPVSRSEQHMAYLQLLRHASWPREFYQPLPPMPYTCRVQSKGWSS